MESESKIFSESLSDKFFLPASRPHLISAGKIFSYYRIEHDGKYFFFKTFTEEASIARKLLRREYELGVNFDNPHLPHIFLYGEYVKGKEGILMEYIDGRTLTDFMAGKPPLRERKKIFTQILDAVGYLHLKGIVHNDIKPDNILITNNGDNVKLIDFGLSDDAAHFLLKTPGYTAAYAAPELLAHRKTDARSDIYSLGAIMTVLFGRRHRRIAGKCKRRIPAKRYADVTALRKAWRRRNRPAKVAMGMAIVFLMIAGVGAGIVDNREARLRTRELEASLQGEKDSYASLKTSYKALTDSIERERMAAERHEKAKQELIESFNNGLRAMMTNTERKLRKANDLSEYINVRQQYVTEVRRYFDNFDKIADGEDLTPILNSLMMSSFNESDNRFDAIQP